MAWKKSILIAILLVLLAAGIYTYKEFNRTQVFIINEVPAFNILVNNLIKEFTEDDSLASRKYVGKIISVSGLVKDINRNEEGHYTVILGENAGMSSIRCSIDSMYSGSAASIVTGMLVKIKGNCTGYNKDELLGLDIILNRCYITDQ